jgi:hypothetical protein
MRSRAIAAIKLLNETKLKTVLTVIKAMIKEG